MEAALKRRGTAAAWARYLPGDAGRDRRLRLCKGGKGRHCGQKRRIAACGGPHPLADGAGLRWNARPLSDDLH